MDEDSYLKSNTLFGFHRDVIIFVMTFLFVRLIVSQRSRNTNKHPPLPSPPGLPLVGNLFSFQEDMREVLGKWTNEIGGIFRLRVGPQDIVVISDIDVIREAFVEQADAFSDRIIPPLINVALGQRGSFLWEAGDRWKKTRKFGHGALRSFGLGQRTMEDMVIEEGRVLIKTCKTLTGKPFNPKVLVTNAVGNIISCLVFGFRFEYDDPVSVKLVNDFATFVDNLSMTSMGGILPFLYYTPPYNNMRRAVTGIISYIKSVVMEHRQSFDPHHPRDIIDLYIAEIKKQREDGKTENAIDESREWRLIFDLYAAGMATTSDSLLWAILIVAQRPDLMKEIQREIDDVIGEERAPKMADQGSMPLTVATLMEVNRIRPVAPLALPHSTSKETTLQGYHIPKKTVVLMNLWEVLNSPKYWNKPEEFNPYRFLSEDQRSVVEPKAFIPFGIGLRVCLGEKLARMQLFIIFISLLQNFTFQLADDSKYIGMKGKAGMTYPPLKYNIILKNRCDSD